jgi:oxygen-independent coproporphyrinogen III oxidase
MDHTILERYGDMRLPRYTSYPTAPKFSAAVGTGTYRDWLAGLDEAERVSLYLHVPFCRSMCWYCGCHTTITQKDQPILDYLDVLKREMTLVAEAVAKKPKVASVHFGGGTPTIMKPEEFLDLVAHMSGHFELDAETELAVEIDPRTLEAGMIEALGAANVTRASLGVQSFDPKVQKAINRIQSAEQTRDATEGLRAAGVRSVNFDLIYGLPHQTVTSVIETAETAIAMKPDRFAVFGYAHVPSFKKHQRLIDENALGDATERHAQAEAIAETLVRAGYRRIGLDHFALPDDGLTIAAAKGTLHRNFQGYTTDSCETLIGFGASAIGRFRHGYVQNDVAIGRYAQAIASGELATAKGYRLTAEDQLRADIIERVMCDFRVDLRTLCDRHGFGIDTLVQGNGRLKRLLDDGIVALSAGVLSVRSEERFLVRAIAACFDAYLDDTGRIHSKAA